MSKPPDPGGRRVERVELEATITVNLNVPALAPFVSEVLTRLRHIERQFENTAQRQEIIMATQQEILDEIATQSTIGDSILVLVQRLVSETDPAARQAILDGLRANKSKFEAAVVAGTPQDPTA